MREAAGPGPYDSEASNAGTWFSPPLSPSCQRASTFPKRQVISLSGDGGFTMLMGDFLSLAQLKLPAKIVVFNNSALGFIEVEQKSTGFLPIGTDLVNPNFAQMAEAIGIKGIRIEDPKDVDAGVAEALAHPGPVVVDAVVAREELAMPPAITSSNAWSTPTPCALGRGMGSIMWAVTSTPALSAR